MPVMLSGAQRSRSIWLRNIMRATIFLGLTPPNGDKHGTETADAVPSEVEG